MEGHEITQFLRHRGARYRELLSKTADPVAAARYRDLIEAFDGVADALERDPIPPKRSAGGENLRRRG